MRNDTAYDFSADIVRIIGTIAVVAIHVTDALIILPNHFGGFSWWWGNLINSFSRTAVPLFIMLSGYLLLNPKKKINNNFYKKRIARVIIPFIFWYFFYLFWNHYHNRLTYKISTQIYNFFTLSLGHLYFLIVIFFLYLITPWIRQVLYSKTDFELQKIIIIIFFIAFVTTIVIYAFPFLVLAKNIFTLPFFYLAYYLYGLLIRKKTINKKTIFFLGLICIGATVLTTVLVYLNTKNKFFWNYNFGQYFHESFSPLIIIMSLSLFTILIKLKKFFQSKLKKFTFFIKKISVLTFGIYLIHPLIIDLVNTYLHLNIHEMHNAIWFWISIKIFIVFIISALIVELYQLTKFFVGGPKET